MDTIFFGSSYLILPIIEELKNSTRLQLVVTTEKQTTQAVPAYCIKHKIPFISVEKFTKETIEEIQKQKVNFAVLADFGLILPDSLLSLFPKGIINIHPSLLPKFRGPTPVQSAMLSGENETGVSIIRLDNQVDHGPLLTQQTETISDSDTAETLHIRLFEKGAQLLIKTLQRYLEGSLIPKPQDDIKATFTKRLTRQSGYFASDTPPKTDVIQSLIRAYYPWPGVWTTIELKGEQKRIKFLPDGKVHVQDKKPMSYKDFLNGYPEKREWLKELGVF
jgi:methionyl-tRNA formyltransferase